MVDEIQGLLTEQEGELDKLREALEAGKKAARDAEMKAAVAETKFSALEEQLKARKK